MPRVLGRWDCVDGKNLGHVDKIGIHDENVLIFLKLFVILYADGTIILSDDVKHFQDMLNVFSEYCKNWKLKKRRSYVW